MFTVRSPVSAVMMIGLAVLSACHRSSEYEYCMANPQAHQCVISDTEDDLWPNPIERQAVRLRTLGSRLQEYVSKAGTLPESIDVLTSDPKAVDLLRDVWGQPVVYRRIGSRYELRSFGPDRRPDTHDDIIIEGA